MVKNKKLFSMILYGHPGIGKTSIATAIAEELGMRYRNLNTVVNNKKDFDTVIEEARYADHLRDRVCRKVYGLEDDLHHG